MNSTQIVQHLQQRGAKTRAVYGLFWSLTLANLRELAKRMASLILLLASRRSSQANLADDNGISDRIVSHSGSKGQPCLTLLSFAGCRPSACSPGASSCSSLLGWAAAVASSAIRPTKRSSTSWV